MPSSSSSDVCPCAPGPLFSCGPCPHGDETAKCAQRLRQRPSHDSYPNKTFEAEASGCATLRVNGTGSRAVPWFEGAHLLRRCAPVFESAHLGKPRRFLRRCAGFSKVRTKNCAPSRNSAPGTFVVARFMAALADIASAWLILHSRHGVGIQSNASAFILPTSVASVAELSHNGGLIFASFCWKVTSHAS